MYLSRSVDAGDGDLTVFCWCVSRTAQGWNCGRSAGLYCQTCASSTTEVSPVLSAHASLVLNWLTLRWLKSTAVTFSALSFASRLNRNTGVRVSLQSLCCAGRIYMCHFTQSCYHLHKDRGAVGQTDALSQHWCSCQILTQLGRKSSSATRNKKREKHTVNH